MNRILSPSITLSSTPCCEALACVGLMSGLGETRREVDDVTGAPDA